MKAKIATQKEVLSFCNSQRKKLGKQPVKKLKRGYRNSERYCPISRTCGKGTFTESHEMFLPDGTKIIIPDDIRGWMYLFDSGEYEKLIAWDTIPEL